MTRRKLLFVDRDGTILVEPEDQQIDHFSKLSFVPGAITALRTLQAHGYELVLVSNQDGLGTASFPQTDFDGPHSLMCDILQSEGVVFAAQHICPHQPGAGCACRKPGVGLMHGYLADDGWSRRASAVIGDRDTDVTFANNLGVRGMQLGSPAMPDWPDVVAALTRPELRATLVRNTNETRIRATIDLDANAPVSITTGIGFFDHMLEQLARHGGFGLELSCSGDLHIDEHHTVEDCALTIGGALAQVIGDKRGLARYGFVVPMDEAGASASLDLSGRAFCLVDADFGRDAVGGLPTEMVGHFFSSLASAAQITLHISVTGSNAHHMIEAAFKATGRALRQALTRYGGQLPTTKGLL